MLISEQVQNVRRNNRGVAKRFREPMAFLSPTLLIRTSALKQNLPKSIPFAFLCRNNWGKIDSVIAIYRIKTKTTEDRDLSEPAQIIALDNQFPDNLNFFCQIT